MRNAAEERNRAEPFERAFGRLLARWRRERGFSQEELAARSGCDRSYLSRLERGLNSPSLGLLAELGSALRMRPSLMLARAEGELGGAYRRLPDEGAGAPPTEEGFRRAFGAALRDLRRQRKLTQGGLAAAAGLHANHVSLLERGQRAPSALVLFRLADALQAHPDELAREVEGRLAESAGAAAAK